MPDKSKSSPPDAPSPRSARLRAGRRRPDRLQPAGARAGPRVIELRLANRHGLVTGATGTGKTVTLQVLAEGFSAAGVPVFAADIKGDLSGLARQRRSRSRTLSQRAEEIGLAALRQRAFPVAFWDVSGRAGPSRARHRAGDGAAAAVAPARADRAAGGRAQHRLQLGRGRAQGGDDKMEILDLAGPARRHRRDGQARRRAAQQVRQHRAGDRGRDPAQPAGAGAAGRGEILRRAGARHQRFPAHWRRTAAVSSIFSRPRS